MPHLDEQLHWLSVTHNKGGLTDSEYQQARTQAITRVGDDYVSPMQADFRDSQWMHDELDYLAQMQQRKVISTAEFESCRAIIVRRHLDAISSPAH